MLPYRPQHHERDRQQGTDRPAAQLIAWRQLWALLLPGPSIPLDSASPRVQTEQGEPPPAAFDQ
mgnify:CR=1 FL=1